MERPEKTAIGKACLTMFTEIDSILAMVMGDEKRDCRNNPLFDLADMHRDVCWLFYPLSQLYTCGRANISRRQAQKRRHRV
jgi:hypothetical protein